MNASLGVALKRRVRRRDVVVIVVAQVDDVRRSPFLSLLHQMLNVEVLDQGLDAVEVDRGLAADRNEETSTVEGNCNFKNYTTFLLRS